MAKDYVGMVLQKLDKWSRVQEFAQACGETGTVVMCEFIKEQLNEFLLDAEVMHIWHAKAAIEFMERRLENGNQPNQD